MRDVEGYERLLNLSYPTLQMLIEKIHARQEQSGSAAPLGSGPPGASVGLAGSDGAARNLDRLEARDSEDCRLDAEAAGTDTVLGQGRFPHEI